MIRVRLVSLPLLLAVAALAAGCGSSSSSSSSSASSSAASSTPAATTQTATTASTTPTSSTGTGASTAPPASASSVAACKSGVQSLPHLKQSVTERLEKLCEKGSLNPTAEREAIDEACREIVNASPLPAGAAKERALAACSKAGAKNAK